MAFLCDLFLEFAFSGKAFGRSRPWIEHNVFSKE
jgi:hypothetical protein